MKIKYNFANETVEIEVPEGWGEILADLDRDEYNNRQKETRRHCSLDALNLDDALLPSEADTFAEVFERLELHRLQRAIARLKPYQQELLKAIYWDGMSTYTYAAKLGISQSAVFQQKRTAEKKLKEFLK